MMPLPGSNGTNAQHADIASWTSTSYIAAIGPQKLPATARIASHPAAGTCRSNVFRPSNAHRDLQHLLVSEFECSNSGATAQEVIIEQGRCNPLDRVDRYVYDTELCGLLQATPAPLPLPKGSRG